MENEKNKRDKPVEKFGGYFPGPPNDCEFPHLIVTGSDGTRWMDLVICAYRCERKCREYREYDRKNRKNRKRITAVIQEA